MVGLGLLGSAIGARLRQAGFTTLGFDLDKDRLREFEEQGGVAVSSAHEAAAERLILCLPTSTIAGGVLRGGRVALDAAGSSQFLSALLLVSPFARGDTQITLTGSLSSAPYAAMTMEIMRVFGAAARLEGGSFLVRGMAGYEGREYTVEPDVSAATVFGAAAAITGITVEIPGIPRGTLQGDLAFFGLLRLLEIDAP